jgi:CAI-1 autoinducer synthase
MECTTVTNHGCPTWFQDQLFQAKKATEPCQDPYPFCHPADTHDFVCLHENDYLRLSKHPRVLAAKAAALNAGQVASSIFSGGANAGYQEQLQDAIAQAMGCEDVALATSGWTANVGLIESIAGQGMPVYLDQKVHASLWDGVRLSKGRPVMVRHNDLDSLERRIRREGPGIVCIDSWYSIDGTVADLHGYVDVCERLDCVLVVDEAHSFGMIGERAGGLAVELGVADRVHFRTCSFSKALGGHGGFVAGSRDMIWHLRHFSRPMIFSSATSPCDAAAHLEALRISQEHPELALQAMVMAKRFRKLLTVRGIEHFPSQCQIVSIPFASPRDACLGYALLREQNVLSAAFLPPAIPEGTGLWRFTCHADVDFSEVEWAAYAVEVMLEKLHGKRDMRMVA